MEETDGDRLGRMRRNGIQNIAMVDIRWMVDKLQSELERVEGPTPTEYCDAVNAALVQKKRVVELEAWLTGWSRVIQDILKERQRQDDQWGGPRHDDAHSPPKWFHFINHQVTRLGTAMPGADYRERLIRIAALAIAAIESLDRKSAV